MALAGLSEKLILTPSGFSFREASLRTLKPPPPLVRYAHEGEAGLCFRKSYAVFATPIFFAHQAVTSGTNSMVTTTLAATSTVAKGAASA